MNAIIYNNAEYRFIYIIKETCWKRMKIPLHPNIVPLRWRDNVEVPVCGGNR